MGVGGGGEYDDRMHTEKIRLLYQSIIKKRVMIKAGQIILGCSLVLLAITAGCSSGSGQGKSTLTVDPNTRFSLSNTTFTNYGFSFEYPENLALAERGILGEKNAGWDNGAIQLKGDTGDNITISWMKMHRIPPNIPIVYEGLWTSTKKDPKIADVKIYNLQTYPTTTCGDASFIGRMSFFDNVRQVQTNEGLLIWYHASQDRLYYIDIASVEDYYVFIRGNLARYQESFRCVEF